MTMSLPWHPTATDVAQFYQDTRGRGVGWARLLERRGGVSCAKAVVLLVMTGDSNSAKFVYCFVLAVRLLWCVLTLECPVSQPNAIPGLFAGSQKPVVSSVSRSESGERGLAALSFLRSQFRLGLSKAGLLLVALIGATWSHGFGFQNEIGKRSSTQS